MRRRRRMFRRCLLGAAVLLTAAMVFTVRLYYLPAVSALAVTQVDNTTSTLINDAIDRQISQGNVRYEDLVTLEKNMDGQITALKTNMAEVNRLKTETLSIINREITGLGREDLGVPLGSVVLPALFSGRGPLLPVRLVTVRTAAADFENRFTQAGINQTLHQIILTVEVTVTVMTPAGAQDVPVRSQVVAAQTVIVGSVPQTVITVTGDQE